MIQIDHTEVFGWRAAIRGMRNPMNSWDNSDSLYTISGDVIIGDRDLKLAQNLSKAGSDHGKFLRFINVTLDINAPLYWWKEFDTYKVGTVSNSCSTMHKITSKPLTLEDFSTEKLSLVSIATLKDSINIMNSYRGKFINLKDKQYWWQLIQMLPTSYNQKRTVQLNYAVLKNMYYARRNHKLDEWKDFCDWVETLPYAKELICNMEEGE